MLRLVLVVISYFLPALCGEMAGVMVWPWAASAVPRRRCLRCSDSRPWLLSILWELSSNLLHAGDLNIGLLPCDTAASQTALPRTNNSKLREIALKVRNEWRVFRVTFNEMSDTHRELDVFWHSVELVVDDDELRLNQLFRSKFID